MWDAAQMRLVTRNLYPDMPHFLAGGPDDLGFADVLFLSEACGYLPNATQVAALDRYIEIFL